MPNIFFSKCPPIFFSINVWTSFVPSAGVNHEELVGLAKTHFSGVSFEYEGDAVPVLSPCRFTGSEVSYSDANVLLFRSNLNERSY